ncbi:MAG: STAS domain-containing protein [Hydrogenophaga sp.]|uniref:STAS domain-containing protein n=1 Tax=Hydrogenophaga sp. TaxID=1904254 RepID=UPI00169F518F|nr:STAS domain-containing protein [Hydrogenophaga sp.]NIM42576.1 STAS domain-containing protein [Hydrogenophaga sp.]NIN27727.1 STAS domain-containing protein [Hydrogenophaga sp.]NIN32547.1 STAS domain-containing protein [Hydrogenophaga sp.]NIN56998.1 STAS domain-containing protein [Hydrogenophaga sp.]NIO53143.1 STAS domain-containing protein [Hydrogenophaga sp.]
MSEARLPARLTTSEAPDTLQSLRRALAAQPAGDFTVDAGGLSSFDSSAVALLLELRRDAQRAGRALNVTNWPPRLRELVAAYGVQELLPA